MTSLSKASFGGKGLTISEVLAFLRSCNPQPMVRKAVPFGSSSSSSSSTGIHAGSSISASSTAAGNASTPSYGKYAALSGSSAVQAVVASMPLVSGHALGVAFLG